MPKANAQVTGFKMFLRNSNNTGWVESFSYSNQCMTIPPSYSTNNMPRSQLLRFHFNDVLQANKDYKLSFVVTTSTNLDYAWFRWGNDFGSGGVLGPSGGYLSQQPSSGQTLNQSTVVGSTTFYAKSSAVVFDVSTGTTGGTFYLDIPTYLLSFNQACLDSYQIQEVGNSSSNDDIINNNNINTQNIITNNNNNTNQIINNQNENTEKEIESQKVCNFIDKSSIVKDNSYLDSTGALNNSNSFGVTDYISISGGTIENLVTYDTNYSVYTCFYNVNKDLISCVKSNLLTDSIPTNSSYVRVSILKYENKPQFNICKNGNQALSDDINDLNNTLNDTNIEGSSIASQFTDINVISDTPITDLITMPLVLLNRLYTQAESTCSPYVLPFNLWGNSNYSLTLPCINLENYLGSSVWSIIDGLFCIFMLYNIGMMIVKFFEKITSLEDIFDSTYVPRHGGGN